MPDMTYSGPEVTLFYLAVRIKKYSRLGFIFLMCIFKNFAFYLYICTVSIIYGTIKRRK